MRNELIQHVINTITEQQLTTFEELHHHAFNEDYYIIGYYNAEQWLIKHDISAFDAIADIIDWQRDAFGEITIKAEDMNAETVVNQYVYIKGEEILQEFDLDQDTESLLFDLKAALS